MIGIFTNTVKKFSYDVVCENNKSKKKQPTAKIQIKIPKGKTQQSINSNQTDAFKEKSELNSPSYYLSQSSEKSRKNFEFDESCQMDIEFDSQQVKDENNLQKNWKSSETEKSIQYYDESDEMNIEYYLSSEKNKNSFQNNFEEQKDQEQKQKRQKRQNKVWTQEEDAILIQSYNELKGKWSLIAQQLSQRRITQCQNRWRRLNPQIIKNQCWTPEEDEIVLKWVEQKGRDWKFISEILGNRSGKQVRERYINKLDPNINIQNWTKEEDDIIVSEFHKIGGKWSEISKFLNGRPENQVKNRFYSHLKKHILHQSQNKDLDTSQNEKMQMMEQIQTKRNINNQQMKQKYKENYNND